MIDVRMIDGDERVRVSKLEGKSTLSWLEVVEQPPACFHISKEYNLCPGLRSEEEESEFLYFNTEF